jgi:hypothetical protein
LDCWFRWSQTSLTPQIGPKRNWRDIAQVADEPRDRCIGGKAVFQVEP